MILLLLACTNECEVQAERYLGVLRACGVEGMQDPFEREKDECTEKRLDNMSCQIDCLAAADCSIVDGSQVIIEDPVYWACVDACRARWGVPAR